MTKRSTIWWQRWNPAWKVRFGNDGYKLNYNLKAQPVAADVRTTEMLAGSCQA